MIFSGFSAFALCSLKHKKLQGYFLIKNGTKNHHMNTAHILNELM